MSGELNVTPAELRSHGSDLAAVAAKVGGAKSAGGTVTGLSTQAFGLLCSFFTPPCLVMSAGALESMDGLQGSVERYARSVPEFADALEATDRQVGSGMNQVRGRLA
ncbi:type VII secretion target [Nocardioides sp. SOB77]|uniref:Type VII secretion target n=1 Tax=Nocardioides oceani TaxID=3058369 RepID=A0ABT8FLK4_9ACTN|nr:type VII secretion target [Nocardioides oceani]MDN4175400.1 type VII secretion target [Nocardioides oceani]